MIKAMEKADKMDKYEKCIELWNGIFKDAELRVPTQKESGNEGFDRGLQWVTEDAECILDFGCGNGTVLFLSALYGTKSHIGIDLSEQAIASANLKSEKMQTGKYQFVCGGVEALQEIESESIDAVILSNIIDNLYPEDAMYVLEQTKRILRMSGKVLIKLNPYLTKEQIEEYQIKVIKDNLLDDGMLLWNNTTEEWKDIIGRFFIIEKYEEINYTEHNQINRMFSVRKG